jgi:hypothetical protein
MPFRKEMLGGFIREVDVDNIRSNDDDDVDDVFGREKDATRRDSENRGVAAALETNKAKRSSLISIVCHWWFRRRYPSGTVETCSNSSICPLE